jgi:hypothetical protein
MNKKIIYLLTAAAFLGLSSCSNVDDVIDVGHQSTNGPTSGIIKEQSKIQAYLGTLKVPGAPLETRAEATPEGSEVSTENIPGYNDGVPGYWVVTKKRYKASHIFDEAIVFDPNAEILYPGCVLRGSSIEDGTFTPITQAEVGDITFSISKVVDRDTPSGSIRRTVFNPRLSDYREIFNDWGKANYLPNAVTSTHSVELVTSKEEAMAKIGVSFANEYVDIAANLGFDFEKEQNHILAKFIQKQYTVTTDFPKTPTIFTSVDPQIINDYQPVYVSNLTYGRMIFLSVDTKHSLAEVQAAFKLAVNAINLNTELEAKYKKVFDESKISMTIIGGGSTQQSLVLADGWEGFKQYMTADISMSESTPISFSLRYAKDNSICRVVSRGEYDIVSRTFVPEFKKMFIEMSLSGLRGSESSYKYEKGDEYEMYGDAWMTFNDQKVGDIFNINRQNYIFVKKGNDFTNVDGKRCILSIEKPDGISFQDFMRSRVRVYTHLYDNDEPSKDKDYGETYQEFYVSDILATHKNGEHKFSVVGHGKGIATETQFKISDIYFK